MNRIVNTDKEFKDLVHVIRGQQVMLDNDLAKLYGTEVKKLIQQVKRNIEKFPDDFMFQLSREETVHISRSQNVTLNKQGKNIKYAPYVFTEQGVYMIATILKNDIATQQSIYLMRSFKEMKHYLAENTQMLNSEDVLGITNRLAKHEEDIQEIKDTMATKTDINKIMDSFLDDTPMKEITFLEGQKFEANEAYINIYKQAKHTIYVIDNYVNINTLSLLKYKQEHVNVTIFTTNKGKQKLHKTEIDNFCNEYPKLYIKKAKEFHDRYIILDYDTSDEVIYHCGHSSKDAGNKVSTIHKMLDTEVIHPVINHLLDNEDFLYR